MKLHIVSFTYGGCLRVFTSKEKAEEFKKKYEFSTQDTLIIQTMEVVE
jgi:hypothetical protein